MKILFFLYLMLWLGQQALALSCPKTFVAGDPIVDRILTILESKSQLSDTQISTVIGHLQHPSFSTSFQQASDREILSIRILLQRHFPEMESKLVKEGMTPRSLLSLRQIDPYFDRLNTQSAEVIDRFLNAWVTAEIKAGRSLSHDEFLMILRH